MAAEKPSGSEGPETGPQGDDATGSRSSEGRGRLGPVTPGPDELHGYFRQVEDHFVRLRGAPFLLTPQDWKTIAGWYEAGVPLVIVRSSLDEVFRKRLERGDDRKVSSIRYCARAVEKAWREAQELQLAVGTQGGDASAAGAVPPQVGATLDEVPWRQRIEALAQQLPEDLPEAAAWRQRILGLQRSPSEQAARQGLAEVERGLLAELEENLTAAEHGDLVAAAEHAVRGLRERVEASALESARRSVMDRLLKERFGLPRLQLI